MRFDQSAINAERPELERGWRNAKSHIARLGPSLSRATKIYDAFNSVKMIRSHLDGSILKAVASGGRAQHGTTPNR